MTADDEWRVRAERGDGRDVHGAAQALAFPDHRTTEEGSGEVRHDRYRALMSPADAKRPPSNNSVAFHLYRPNLRRGFISERCATFFSAPFSPAALLRLART